MTLPTRIDVGAGRVRDGEAGTRGSGRRSVRPAWWRGTREVSDPVGIGIRNRPAAGKKWYALGESNPSFQNENLAS